MGAIGFEKFVCNLIPVYFHWPVNVEVDYSLDGGLGMQETGMAVQ